MKSLMTPRGYNEMIKLFGNIKDYINEDGTLESEKWESLILTFCYLPFPMLLSWNQRLVTRFKCHHLLEPTFTAVFDMIYQKHLEEHCRYFGGCYMYRAMSGAKKISTHAWAIAIDINPETNQLGTEGDMHPGIIECFEFFGFVWGGRFERKDPMHFQFVEGY